MLYFLEEFFDIEDYICADSKWFPIFELAKFIIVIIQIAVPFALIIWGSLDWFKALIAHDEKEMRIKRKPFITRVVAALIVLILPWIVQLISNHLSGKAEFWTCYSEAKPRIDFKSWDNYSDFWDDDTTGPTTTIDGTTISSVGTSGNGQTSIINEMSNGLEGIENGYDEVQNEIQEALTEAASANTKTKCGQFTSEEACNNGKTATHKCKWKDLGQTSYNNTGSGTCVRGEPLYKYTCTELGQGCNGKKIDDYGAACKPNGVECVYNTEAKTCEDYGQTIAPSSKGICEGQTDDYGIKCKYVQTNAYSGKCISE